jgi:hypothetical protein
MADRTGHIIVILIILVIFGSIVLLINSLLYQIHIFLIELFRIVSYLISIPKVRLYVFGFTIIALGIHLISFTKEQNNNFFYKSKISNQSKITDVLDEIVQHRICSTLERVLNIE